MVSFLIQAIFLFAVVIFQISFLNLVFSQMFLNALLATAIGLTLTRGFFHAWPWVLFLGFLFDIMSMDVAGVTPLVLIVLSYGISFLSRRFLVEHKASGIGLAVFFMAVTSVFYFPLIWSIRHVILGVPLSGSGLMNYFSNTPFVASIIFNSILFLALYSMTLKISQMLNFYEDRVVVKR